MNHQTLVNSRQRGVWLDDVFRQREDEKKKKIPPVKVQRSYRPGQTVRKAAGRMH